MGVVSFPTRCTDTIPAAPATTPFQAESAIGLTSDAVQKQNSDSVGVVSMKLATCNVLTLLPPRTKRMSGVETGPARQESLFRQMDEAAIHVFGFQETRLRRLSNAHDPRFWIYKSAATAHGHFGTMISLARNRHIGQIHQGDIVQDVFIMQEHVAIIAAEPRFLILRLKTVLFQAILISACATHGSGRGRSCLVVEKSCSSHSKKVQPVGPDPAGRCQCKGWDGTMSTHWATPG